MKLSPLKSFNNKYLSRETTTAIKGIFVFLVFLSHFSQYYPFAEQNNVYSFIQQNTGQLIVTMFLFYSGYGIFESVKRKGSDYVKTFPKNRILKTLFHFDCAILLFYFLNLYLKRNFGIKDYLLALIGWTSIGNSNWFIFTIIILYLIVFISFIIFKNNHIRSLITVTVLTISYMLVLARFKENYWFNTALCLPLGLWYSYLKDFVEKIAMKNNIIYTLFCIFFAIVYYISFTNAQNGFFYVIWTLSFVAIILLIIMKINICNKALIWLGNHVFSIYILQRIPMMILTKKNVQFDNIDICLIVCFIITVIISQLFDMLMDHVDKKLFNS